MKVAILHDELVRRGGAERVTLAFQKAFPDAPIYTSVYREDLTFPDFKKSVIHTSVVNKYINNEKQLKKFFFPFVIWGMQRLNIKGYDVVLMSSTHCAKYPNIAKGIKVVNYCHTPFRLAWLPNTYLEYLDSKGVKRKAFDILIKILKKIDYKAAQRTDLFLTNAQEIVERIKKYYSWKQQIEVINPPINCDEFYVEPNSKKDYYIVVCRLEYYKKVDLVIEAFNRTNKKLIIVGKGSQSAQLKKLAKSTNIEFKTNLGNDELATLYANAKALVFPQYEDYGITPLEANASGIPVIAFGEGGIKETMIPYTGDASKATAVFFKNQTVEDVEDAITKFEELNFDASFIRKHAEEFDEKMFIKRIQEVVYKIGNKQKETAHS